MSPLPFNPELTYVRVEQDGKAYYLAKDAVRTAMRGDHTITRELTGADLIGRAISRPIR